MPVFNKYSPEVVKILDDIRFNNKEHEHNEDLLEFYWFIREYPRIYRHHLDHAKYRLKMIYSRYIEAKKLFEQQINRSSEDCFELAISNENVSVLYWDFESYLSAVNVALDVLARIVGTAYGEQTPVSFNKLCNKNLDGIVSDLNKAKSRWVSRMKDYRDCFVHYTPVDTLLMIRARRYSDGWELRAKLPTNPNSRDILMFKFSRRVELLKYSISTYKHMMALDKLVAKKIYKLYKANEYPKRTNNLFNIGIRQ